MAFEINGFATYNMILRGMLIVSYDSTTDDYYLDLYATTGLSSGTDYAIKGCGYFSNTVMDS